MSETRYNRLVDGQPTQNRYTVLGDVTGSIEISMEFKTAVSAKILRTVSVPFVDVTTGRTFLRGYSLMMIFDTLWHEPPEIRRYFEKLHKIPFTMGEDILWSTK